jgi:hypothetical protein
MMAFMAMNSLVAVAVSWLLVMPVENKAMTRHRNQKRITSRPWEK